MAGKPKAGFWIVTILVILGLVGFALYRAGIFGPGDGGPGVQDFGQTSGQTPAKGNALELLFYTSSAKQKWADEMVKIFNGRGVQVEGRPVLVKAFHVTSGGSLDDLKDGKIKPDLWSPGDESWLQLGQAYWRDIKQKTLYDEYLPLVNIPLVVAMWEPMAKALGYPNPIGWKDIAKVAADPQGWAALGHPEWGRFRWGHAHPDANSGFLTIISEVYAALGKTSGISPEDLKNPEVMAFLEKFEGAVEHYGLSNSWIDDLMYAKGPSYLSATVQYENTIIESNEKHQNKPFKMVAIYPAEGNTWTQHPVAILKEDWVTPEKAAAAKLFVDFLLGDEAQRRAMEMGLRPISKKSQLAAPFDDAHGVQADISTDKAYQVPDEAVLKRIRDLWEEVKVPATIIMILDRSGSMEGEPMDSAKEGAELFVKSMKPRDELQIVVFNQRIAELTPLCTVKECGEEAVTKLQGLFAEGKTSLYDAIQTYYRRLDEMRKSGQHRRYALLVLSDGKDTSSGLDRYDFLDKLPKGEDFDAPKVYTIAYGPEADKDLLAEIANRTNARLFTSSPKEIAKTYKELSANF
ncbi:MAG: VWA domain-containing protein [Thermodesulfobacteriota bacterium]